MSVRRGKHNQVRKVLVGIILATLPCYCIGLLLVNLVESGDTERPTATASPTAEAPQVTLPATETATLLPTFTYIFTPTGTASPTASPTSRPTLPIPSITPTATDTAPPPPPPPPG